jgi:predicted metalloprotease
MRSLSLRGIAALVLVTGCAPAHKGTADLSGRTASALPAKEFVKRIVGSTEDVWTQLFQSVGTRYEPPTVVLFTRSIVSSCGSVSTAAGPFYCPSDRKVYLDTTFLSELPERSGAYGDFAQAYLVVHEISHHVQHASGTMQQFDSAPSLTAERQRNQLQVRRELQADCYTGVWAFYVQKRNMLEPGDLEEVPAAQALSDPSTYGTAAQRLWWFKQGFATGDPGQCETFKVSQP